MDFREATDKLFARVTQADLADALGSSVHLVRQARLRSDATGHRSPPDRWDEAVLRLAEERVFAYRALIKEMRDRLNADT